MSRTRLSALILAALMASPAMAEPPKVAADVAPVHSLVARVMDGVAVPALVIKPGGSPHEYSLRPSEARILQTADVVFLVGEDLTPWMVEAVETLAARAQVVTLLEAEGTAVLDLREEALFEPHEHEGGHDGHDIDPHAWLSPDNAAAWLDVIAEQLALVDPDNAGMYRANATAGRSEIADLKAEIHATLSPVRGKRFIVFHDAYQYFETAFDFPASGAISLSDATDPGPARVNDIRNRVRAEAIGCVLAEPQFNPTMVATVVEGTEARIRVIDPLGANLDSGPNLYRNLLKGMASALADCLS